MQGKLIIFSAPSGSGKTTIVRHILQQEPGVKFSISATSRKPRPGETDGIDYFFLTPGEFRKKIEQDAFLEWEEVYENQFYGTLKSEVERLRNKGIHVIFDIDVVGGLNLKKTYGGEALAVFVQPPSVEIMEQRLRLRGTDDEEQLKKRISKATHELAFAGKFDQIIINDKLEDSLRQAEILVRDFIRN